MFSRGHPCLRRRLSVVLDAVAAGPDEPLLFLYPRWAASTHRHHRPITSLTPAAAPAKTCRAPFRTAVCLRVPLPSLRSQSCQWISSSAVSLRKARGSTNDYVDLVAEIGDTKFDGGKKAGGDAVSGQGVAAGPQQPADHPLVLPDVPSNELTRIRGRRRRRVLGSRGLLKSKPKPSVEGISVRDQRLLRASRFIGTSFDARQSATRRGKSVPTWRQVTAFLNHLQNKKRLIPRRRSKHSEILIPEETVGLLLGVSDHSFRENIYFSSIRNGCWVRILPPAEGDGFSRKAILSGSENAKELVKESIARAQWLQAVGDPLVDMAKPPAPIISSFLLLSEKKIYGPLVRGVWAREKLRPLSLDQVLKFRRPITSMKSFLEHIEDLTWVQEKSSGKPSGPPGVAYKELVREELLALFQGDENRKYFSTAALNCALEYLCKHEMLSSVREVFNSAEPFATVDSYNILLESAARRMDSSAFYAFLNSMRRKYIHPTTLTWIALLKSMVTAASKANIIQCMARKGLLDDPGTVQTVLRLTIDDSLHLHLQSGKGVESFVDLMAQTQGANWINSSLLNQMIHVITRMKNYDAVKQLLKVSHDRNLRIESKCLNPIVVMFRSNIYNAMHYTVQLLNRASFSLDSATYELLFLVAFKARRYNICRVLWHFACTEDKVTYKMRQCVLTSLCRNVSVVSNNDQIGNIWRISAGNVISGLELGGLRRFPAHIIKSLPDEFKEEPLLYLNRPGFVPMGPRRDLQLQIANLAVQQEIEYGPRFTIDLPLGIMLEAAVTMDREWANKPWPLTWLKQNAIQVPMTLQGVI
ncbi:hypothetical protein N7476_008833 [Penicillium atrosanguineum]|uniref:Pentatricopeptide repeat-containing protein n=1 Tax=Penicillium atrosanguineum TaxID=1132637 RepID=A0A9W9PSF3_9EURO|nr:hypothetical protein N7476_008833 [Penicillium atrosanguineum]